MENRELCNIPVELRNSWLEMSEEAFAAISSLEMYKGSGKGGQKRNKTSTAIRIVHLPTGISATDCSERSQLQNRRNALKKLRLAIAFSVRSNPPAVIQNPETGLNNRDYPLWLAQIMDLLHERDYHIKETAETLGVSTARLIKLLYRDPQLWQAVNHARQRLNLQPLHKPLT